MMSITHVSLKVKSEILCIACLCGYLELAEIMILMGVDPQTENNTPIINASMLGRLDIVNYLLAYGADPSARSSEAFIMV